MLFSAAIISFGHARFLAKMIRSNLFGVALLCGIGFTMSIFVGSLAFEAVDIGYTRIDRLAIILASCLASIAWYIVLRFLLS